MLSIQFEIILIDYILRLIIQSFFYTLTYDKDFKHLNRKSIDL